MTLCSPTRPSAIKPTRHGALPSGESWGPVDGNTNVSLYTDTLIFPYISSNITVLKCPADVVPSANGQRLRSYSMNGQMGTTLWDFLEYSPGYLCYIR